MRRSLGPVAIGVLCGIPVALIAGWFAINVFDPATTDKFNYLNAALDMGPFRGVEFAVGALLAAAIVAPRIADEDVGTFGGLFRFIALAHLFAFTGATIEIVVRDPSILEPSFFVAWPLWLVVLLGPSLFLWLPTGAVWVVAVRRLTVEDLVAPTDLERAQSEQLRNDAAREHVTVDATNLADQGSRLYRNRG